MDHLWYYENQRRRISDAGPPVFILCDHPDLRAAHTDPRVADAQANQVASSFLSYCQN
jgi:hypothetical protein